MRRGTVPEGKQEKGEKSDHVWATIGKVLSLLTGTNLYGGLCRSLLMVGQQRRMMHQTGSLWR